MPIYKRNFKIKCPAPMKLSNAVGTILVGTLLFAAAPVVVPTIADVSLTTVRVILELGRLGFVAYQAFGA